MKNSDILTLEVKIFFFFLALEEINSLRSKVKAGGLENFYHLSDGGFPKNKFPLQWKIEAVVFFLISPSQKPHLTRKLPGSFPNPLSLQTPAKKEKKKSFLCHGDYD